MIGTGDCLVTARTSQLAPNTEEPIPVSRVIRLVKGIQRISAFTWSEAVDDFSPYSLSASSNSGLPVSFAKDTGACEVVGNQLRKASLLAADYPYSCVIRAMQSGSSLWQKASDAFLVFNFKVKQAILTVDESNIGPYWNDQLQIIATTNSGSQPYAAVSSPTVCRFEGLIMIPIGRGTCGFNIIAPATNTYSSASSRWYGIATSVP